VPEVPEMELTLESRPGKGAAGMSGAATVIFSFPSLGRASVRQSCSRPGRTGARFAGLPRPVRAGETTTRRAGDSTADQVRRHLGTGIGAKRRTIAPFMARALLHYYNHERPHLGCRSQRRRPWETSKNPA
jgi:hypothetical protein